ncbi:LacI family DNA-binding transcriptional regulator [Ochrobactrum soli]|uniref:LacI family DNA-binding transcriptional regulator n=1 Tax=Ochrobactrum soli TaxID=2448455 RepID=UPI000D693BBC|nr:LacI family DNA-binding transcriptional regulator [[Ochrobactrum] soli]
MRTKRSRSISLNLPVVTMSDVADKAGVSPQTVSRVIGRPELVAEKTRLHVQQIIRELNYIPNEAARNLASNSSRVVAVVIPTLSSSAFAAEVKSIIDVMEKRGISVIIGNSEYSAQREENIIRTLLERRPLGFILTGNNHTPVAEELLRASSLPIVETWDTDREAIDMATGFSNIAAGRAVGDLFVARGAKRIAFVGGGATQDPRASARFEGLAEAIAAAGLSPACRVELTMPMNTQDGVIGMDEVLRRQPLTDAIFFSADSLALAALLECNRRRIRVPDQLAICGFGDFDLAPFVSPALTTVRIQPDAMGERAAHMLLSRLDGAKNEKRTIVLDHQLIRRGTA